VTVISHFGTASRPGKDGYDMIDGNLRDVGASCRVRFELNVGLDLSA